MFSCNPFVSTLTHLIPSYLINFEYSLWENQGFTIGLAIEFLTYNEHLQLMVLYNCEFY
jgi:hypothetical protein